MAFTLPSVPLAATLVVVDNYGAHPAVPTAITMTAVHRFVSWGQYVWWPCISGCALAALFLVLALLVFYLLQRQPRPRRGQPIRPIYASSGWTFRDSWATNIGTGATAVAAILTGAGAVSTQLPGVQLDRYAVLMAVCGLIIVSAPLIFGIFHVIPSPYKKAIPKNAEVTHAPDSLVVDVPSGATLTFPSRDADAKDPVPVSPGTIRIGADIPVVLPGDDTMVLKGPGDGLTVRTVQTTGVAQPPGGRVEVMSPVTVPGRPFPFVTIKVAGFASVKLPGTTTARFLVPGGEESRFEERRFGRGIWVRIPQGDNVIAVGFGPLIAAALVTLFGIGAELGIFGVLAFSLSDRTTAVRWTALGLIVFMALVVVGYAIATTTALVAKSPGSALAPDSSTAAVL